MVRLRDGMYIAQKSLYLYEIERNRLRRSNVQFAEQPLRANDHGPASRYVAIQRSREAGSAPPPVVCDRGRWPDATHPGLAHTLRRCAFRRRQASGLSVVADLGLSRSIAGRSPAEIGDTA